LVRPAVAAVDEIADEQRHRQLVGADGRVRQRPRRRDQRGRPLLEIGWPPLPRVLVGERCEAPDQSQPVLDRGRRQVAAALLRRPPVEHGLEDQLGGVQCGDAWREHEVRGPFDRYLLLTPEVGHRLKYSFIR
jgi:hypothetical protein